MSTSDREILLVEDNSDDEVLTLRAFRKSNIANKIVVARDGVEALSYLHCTGVHAGRDPSQPPQLVLLDLNLPRISGLEVLRRLRADPRTKLTPVVVLTSSKEEEDMIASYSLGANSYVRKPVDFGDFAKAICSLGFFWLLLNETLPGRRGKPRSE